jgi:hypothetical protein
MKGIKAVCDGRTTACDLVDANGSRQPMFVSRHDRHARESGVSSASWPVGLISAAAVAASPAFAGAALGDNVIRLT